MFRIRLAWLLSLAIVIGSTGFNPTIGEAPGAPLPNISCMPQQNPHAYGAAVGGRVHVSYPMDSDWEASATYVMDSNVEDCNGDGIPYDFDGDNDYGVGGGFFPADHHGPFFFVEDQVGGRVEFTVGSDLEGDIDCFETFVDSGTTSCPAGINGGWWVFVLTVLDPDSEEVLSAPTFGFIFSPTLNQDEGNAFDKWPLKNGKPAVPVGTIGIRGTGDEYGDVLINTAPAECNPGQPIRVEVVIGPDAKGNKVTGQADCFPVAPTPDVQCTATDLNPKAGQCAKNDIQRETTPACNRGPYVKAAGAPKDSSWVIFCFWF